VVAAVLVAAGLAAAIGVLLTGAAAAPVLGDPGALVRWGSPVIKALHDLSAALTLGTMVLAATAIPPSSPAWTRAVRLAGGAAVVWTLAALAVLVTGYADVTGQPLGSPAFGGQLGVFVTQVSSGRLLLLATVTAAAVAILAVAVRTPTGAGLVALAAAVALVPLSLTGHAAGASGHEAAVSSWWLHVVGVSVWFGGLAGLALVSCGLGRELAAVAGRFSTLAGWGFALVVSTGLVNAWLQLRQPSDLLEGYGLLLVAKTAAATALGVAGYAHRRRLLPALAGERGRPAFSRLVVGELVVFGVAMGLAAALSRSAPPAPDAPPADPTPAELLTGEPLPPPLTPGRWFTETAPDLLWLVVAVSALVAYGLGVRTLRARGDRWPWHRTMLWVLGCLTLVYVTSGGPAAYGRTLFSAHMVQHMMLSMVVPALLVLAAPVTLAVRALPRRRDGSRGPREWLLGAVESRPGRLLAHPLVAAGLFAGSLVVFYYSPLFGLSLRTHVGHELMMIHFLVVGYLFCQALVGVDPGPSRPGYPFRLLLLFATMAFHAFFGVALIAGDTLLEPAWFSSTGWGIDALADQRTGGGIAWGIGELPTVLLALVVAVQWARSDDREARRGDRKADRDHDAELAGYNAMLARMGERTVDRRSPSGRGSKDR
jgi:putative copper resistance protein D